MSEIITFSDMQPSGTFAQIKLDDGKRVLISFTQTEVAVLKLIFGGNIPTGKIWKFGALDYVEKVGRKDIARGKSPLEVAAQAVLSCKTLDEVPKKMNELVN